MTTGEIVEQSKEYIKKNIEYTINNLEMAIRKLKQYDSAVADILDDKDLFEFNKK